MAYRVALRPAAQRQLGRLHGPLSIALHGVILSLADDPRPPASTKLVGSRNLWRIKVRIFGRPWRIIYQVDDRLRLVRLLRVVPRDEGAYRGIR